MVINCHICDNQYKKKQSYLYCEKCTHIFTPPPCDPIEFHSHEYRTKYGIRQNGEVTQSGVSQSFHKNRREIVRKRTELIKQYLNVEQCVIDIGAGAGTFAVEISKYVKLVECIELDQRLIQECRRLGFTTYCGDFLKIAHTIPQFDVVFAWHVLEHVIELKEFIYECIQRTKNGGMFIFEVPVNRKIPQKYTGHCHHFSTKSIQVLTELLDVKNILLRDGVQSPASLVIINL